jgi:hypothetical protein
LHPAATGALHLRALSSWLKHPQSPPDAHCQQTHVHNVTSRRGNCHGPHSPGSSTFLPPALNPLTSLAPNSSIPDEIRFHLQLTTRASPWQIYLPQRAERHACHARTSLSARQMSSSGLLHEPSLRCNICVVPRCTTQARLGPCRVSSTSAAVEVCRVHDTHACHSLATAIVTSCSRHDSGRHSREECVTEREAEAKEEDEGTLVFPSYFTSCFSFLKFNYLGSTNKHPK